MSSIIVGVRVRPFNQRELKYNSVNIVTMTSESNCIALTNVRQGKVVKEEKPKEFFFDYALWTHDTTTVQPMADQKYVYEKMGQPVLKNVMEGYNACLFAYGQTGSGKTYSMMGYGAEPGVIPRLCEELFQHASETHDKGPVQGPDGSVSTTLITVEASYLEIYNEIVRDLLGGKDSPEGGLKIRQHPKTGVFVEGLKKVATPTKEAIVKLLDEGQILRSVAATNMNATSSRSHAILMLQVTQTTTTTVILGGKETTTTAVKAGKLSLVDLAGSERASSTGATGDTLTEGANINKSLTFLGMCLSRLAELAESHEKGHIPFRDSSLTFLLSENLGGNSKTSMLANISPAEINFDETLSTLRFAQVTKKVKNHATVNENPTTKLIRELKDELEGLKAELKRAQERAALSSAAAAAAAAAQAAAASESQAPIELDKAEDKPLESGTPLAAAEDVAELLKKVQESEAAATALEVVEEEAVEEPAAGDQEPKKTGSVFVDWRRPQLVNLCPEGSVLTIPIEDGSNVYRFNPTNAASNVTVAPAPLHGDDGVPGADSRVVVDATGSGPADVQSVALVVDFSPLLNQAKLIYYVEVTLLDGASSNPQFPIPAYNGAVLDPTSTEEERSIDAAGRATIVRRLLYSQPLRHSDRLVVGRMAFRFSHTSALPSMPEYSQVPSTVNHLEQLETVTRQREIELAWLEELSSLFREYQDERRGLEPVSPASPAAEHAVLPLTEELNDATAAVTADMRRNEDRLIDEFPVTLEEQNEALDRWRLGRGGAAGSSVAIPDEDYSTVVNEAKKGVEEKNSMIQKLREELEKAAAYRRQREVSMARQVKEVQEAKEVAEAAKAAMKAAEEARRKKEQEEELAMNKQLEEELQWHAKVRKIRVFSATGPIDEADRQLWVKLSGNPESNPTLYQLLREAVEVQKSHGSSNSFLKEESSSGVTQSSQSLLTANKTEKGFELPVTQCGKVFKQKQKGTKWEERFALIHKRFLYYFYKCDGREHCRGAIYLYGATVVRPNADLGRKHCLLLTASCPRAPNDSNSFYFSFANEDDLNTWEAWISDASAPPMPPSMRLRLQEEEERAIEEGRRSIRRGKVSGSVTVGDMGKFNWKDDASVAKCEHCNTAFSFFTRRHHCTLCGGIFCDKCAPKAGNERKCGMCRQYGTSRPSAQQDDFDLVE